MIQAKLAEMYALYEAARGLTYRAAVLAENARRGGKGTELTRLAAAAALFAARPTARSVTRRCRFTADTAIALSSRCSAYGGMPS